MEWTIPGTVLTAPRADADHLEKDFKAMFLAGGIMLGQVAAISGLEPYDVQNWVKRRLLPPPVNKRYNLTQLCRILNINMLKKALPMEQICGLLGHINGELDDTSDDLIDDSKLYFLFVKLAARARHMGGEDWEDALLEVTADYHEPQPGARQRLITVLRIMLTAWVASKLLDVSQEMIRAL
jgi:DNA-binding transcriptional MerR regulator